jgi:hypothetical protein
MINGIGADQTVEKIALPRYLRNARNLPRMAKAVPLCPASVSISPIKSDANDPAKITNIRALLLIACNVDISGW